MQSIFLFSNSLKPGLEISKIKVGYAVAVSFILFTEAVSAVSELCLQVSKPKNKYLFNLKLCLTSVSVQHYM